MGWGDNNSPKYEFLLEGEKVLEPSQQSSFGRFCEGKWRMKNETNESEKGVNKEAAGIYSTFAQ